MSERRPRERSERGLVGAELRRRSREPRGRPDPPAALDRPDPAAVLEWTGGDDYHLFGGFEDGALVAVAGVLIGTHLHHRRVAWLYDLVVDEPRRGEGYGADVVAAVEELAREHECEAVALASPLAKEGTHAFYESAGYERWGYVIEKQL